jgi:hypothetical protein
VSKGGQSPWSGTPIPAGCPPCASETCLVVAAMLSVALANAVAGTVTHCVATAGSIVVTVTKVVGMLAIATLES